MKSRNLFLPIMVVSGVLALQSHCFADDGSEIIGTETFEAKVILTGTTNAPDASGRAEIESENDNGTVTGQMQVETSGLVAGDYQVNVVKTSDGSTENVGTLTVGGDDTNEVSVTSTNEDSLTCTNGSSTLNLSSSNSVWVSQQGGSDGEGDFTLPSDLNAADIAQVVVADSLGNPVLTGDVGGSNSINFNATVHITAGPAAPNAQGIAQLQNHVNKGKQKAKFLLNATGVPANTTLNVVVNGSVVGTVKSTKSGHVKLNKLPVDLMTVQTIELQDGGGATVGTAQF